MKLLFVHDHPFYKENDKVYSGGGLPSSIWKNYLSNFAEIYVYGRNSIQEKDKKIISSTDNVSFYLTNHYSSVKRLFFKSASIKKELQELIEKTDIVLIRLPSVLGLLAGAQALKMNKKLWIEQVGNAREALDSQGSVLGKIVAPFFEYENKRIVSKANFVSYVTENKLQLDYPANKNAVTVSLSDVIINSIEEKSELNQERYFGPDLRIGLIGGFDAKYKGQDVLLKAVDFLDENIKKNIKLNFVGKGNYDWILELAEKLNLSQNIEFIGALESGEEINEFLKKMSLYVQPSLTEGMPRASIEAMSMGCAIIGSNVGGIPDIVSAKFIHEKGNYQLLSNHINYFFKERKELQKEAFLSLEKVFPYLKSNLDKKRLDFYIKMNNDEN